MTTTMAPTPEHRAIHRTAERTWRRAGVLRRDRKQLHEELSVELTGAQADGVEPSAILGDDSRRTLRSWAHAREMSGRALRLALVVPAAILGILTGTSLVLATLHGAFRGWSDTLDPGRPAFALAFYASGALLGYLCALVSVGAALHGFEDPHATSTTRRLALLLPAGAALCSIGGVAVASVRGFTTTTPTFLAVAGIVVAGLVATVTLARYLAVRPEIAST
ncbi:hypothetical protein [Tsukamurella pulmonis]|uniref:hypothetical protein n=2 Tax=Tsukamurella pulmonis TaxID=47312 RepID=UPI000B2B66AE|nr:hypothetical protein [Tsukamurella pulmonis]